MRLKKISALLIFLLTPVILMAVVWVMQPGQAQAALAWQQVQLARARNQPAEAAAALQHVVAVEPWRIDLYEQIGSFEVAAGNFEAAIAAFTKSRQLNVLSPAGCLRLAQLLVAEGENSKARVALLQLCTSGRLDGDVYRQIVSQMEIVGPPDDLLRCLDAWLEQDPKNAQALYRKAVYLALGQPAQAALALEQAVLSDNGYSSSADSLLKVMDAAAQAEEPGLSALQMGRGLMQLGEMRAAKVALDQAVIDQPDLAEAWAFLAEARQNLGESGDEAIQQALTLSPESSIVQALAAIYWRRMGKPEVGLVYLHAAATQEPQNAFWQIELGKTLVEMDNPQDALSHFVRATELEPKNSQAWVELARFSLNYGVETAQVGLPAARRAVLLAPKDARALDIMGALLFSQNDFSSAERFLQQSLQQDAANADANLHLGQVYLATGDLAAARPYLEEAVRLSPETAVGRLAGRLIQQNYSTP